MSDYSVLIAVAFPASGPELLRVSRLLAAPGDLHVTALHCRSESMPEMEASQHTGERSGGDPLEILMAAADNLRVDPVSIVSADVADDILSVARSRAANLILTGWHRPMVDDGENPGPVRSVLERAESDVAVFLARQFRPFRRVLVPFHGGRHDQRGLELAARIARNADVSVTVLHVVSPDRSRSAEGTGLSSVVEDISDGRVRLKVVESDDTVDAAIREAWTGYDLIVAGASEAWGVDFTLFSERLQRLAFATPASLLVVHASARHQAPATEKAGMGMTRVPREVGSV